MTTAIDQIRHKAAERKAALKAELETAAQGGEVDPDQILADATAVNISHVEVAQALDVLTERFERQQAFTAGDWDARIEAAKAEAIAAHTATEEANAAAEAARAACKTANDRYQRSINLRQQAIDAKNAAAKEFDKFMKQTAGSGRDTTDWRNIPF